MKHIQIKHMFLQKLQRNKVLTIFKVPGVNNSTDIGTKCLERALFEKHRKACNLREPEQPLANVEEETVHRKKGSGLPQVTESMKSCLMGLLMMLQVGGTRGTAIVLPRNVGMLMLPVMAVASGEKGFSLMPLAWLLLGAAMTGALLPLGYLWLAKQAQAATLPAAAVAEPARPFMVERRIVVAGKATLCNLRATDEHEIDKMTIDRGHPA